MLKGGIADKFGNEYETLWTLAEALRVLRGEADEIRIEPFNEDAKGLEFRITTQGRSAWHQCKRRLTSGAWTLAALDSAGVLSTFMRKLADPSNDCVFVSSDPAPDLKALSGKAAIVDSVRGFLDCLSKDDQLNLQRLAKAWPADQETLFNWLRRVRVETVSELSLRRELTGLCALLFTVEPEVAIERLAGYLDDTVTHVVTPEAFRAAVDIRGLGWHARFDGTLNEKLAAATDGYLDSLPQPIAGVEIETPELTEALAAVFDGPGTLTIVSGSAGGGKSLVLARIVAEARRRGWRVLGLRIDWFLDVHALPAIGNALVGREENPVGVLGNHAGNGECVLVIDQVDAVSEASGRSGRASDLVFQMIRAARYFPRLRVIIACRRYDMDNDSRLKQLETSPGARTVRLKPLDWTSAVQPVLERLGLGARYFSKQQRDVLAVPINLHIFASLASAGEAPGNDLTGVQLFDRLLDLRARELRAAGVTWSVHTALSSLATWMSDNQVLTAPATILAAFPGAVDLLSSQGLVAKAAGRVQFAHESFFDHVFSADFVAQGARVIALLKSDQQRLFRRTQVRQIFARLRDHGDRPYLDNLREVMDAPDVRYLVKDAVAAWLGSVDSPTLAEVQLVESWLERGQASEHLAFAAMSGPRWLPLLIRCGAITRLIAADGRRVNLAFWMLRNGAVSHSGPVAKYLREWWRGEPERTPELLSWFGRLHPDGPIGDLEELYKDAIAAAPEGTVKSQFDEEFELGAWLHKKQYALGARVLGWWLARWMAAFSDAHPFGRGEGRNSRYWIKELVDHAPVPFLEAVWPVFVEGLRRERLELLTGRLIYPTIRLDVEDDSWIRLVGEALTKLAAETPVQAEAYLDALPPESAPALWLHLRAITANGAALSYRLPSLLDSPDLLHLGEHGGEWRPFAEAARASMAFLVESERHRIEARVMGHRPEYERARRAVGSAREDGKGLEAQDRIYAARQLARTGEVERAILLTIGADILGPAATRRLSELERKFAGQPLPEAFGIRGGWVRSPIKLEKAALMSDAQWLKAVRRYAGNEGHIYESDGIVGGAEQLANVLQSRVKEQPERFVRLLERLPTDANPVYAGAVLSGLRESACKDGTTIGLCAIRTAARWGTTRFRREMCWLVEKWPDIGRDPDVFRALLDIAATGDASDTAVRFATPGERSRVQDLLQGSEELETSAINGDRGVAWRALAAVLWIDQAAIEPVVALFEGRMDSELTSVRMCMLEAVNATAKHDVSCGLSLLERLARRDLIAIHSMSGRHMLQWAAYNHTVAVRPILDRLTASGENRLRALGLTLEAALALSDDTREADFSALFAEDALRRRVAAFVAVGNLSVDTVGDRAERWLRLFFDDREPEVRSEAALVDWAGVLDGPEDRTGFALAFLRSPVFADDPEHLMRAIDDRIDRFPRLTLEAVSRVLALEQQWAAEGRQRHSLAVHHLGKVLVALYRAVESNRESEEQILDLIDTYLASDLRELSDEIRAYERH